MREKIKTDIPGTRTAAIQYEFNHTPQEKSKTSEHSWQPVRQGNKKYPVSPIYSKKTTE